MEQNSYHFFLTALKYQLKKLREEKKNLGEDFTQKQFAKEVLKISPEHFSGILNQVKGRRAGEHLQGKIAKVFGYKHFEFLELGEQLEKKQNPDTIVIGPEHHDNRRDDDKDIMKLVDLLKEYASRSEIRLLIKRFEKRKENYKTQMSSNNDYEI